LANEQLRNTGMPPLSVQAETEEAVEEMLRINTLVAIVEFAGSDSFVYSASPSPSGRCRDVEVTTEGPLHNQIAIGPRDNITFWLSDFTPEVYDQIYFGVGPEAGVIADHPNLGEVDLRGMTVANYYLEQSNGEFAPTGSVYPRWLQVSHSEGWYGAPSCEDGLTDVRSADLVREVVDAINGDDPAFSWQDFDANADGVVDNFTVIHAGMGEEAGGGVQGEFSIWSHASSVNWPDGYLACKSPSPGCPDRDIAVLDYSMDPENFDVGVGAEEFGHAAFGLPDIYTTDYENSVSHWAIMSGGSWNGPLAGMQPAPFPLWFRYVIGWSDPLELDYTTDPTSVYVGQHSLTPDWPEVGIKINLPDASRYLTDPYDGEAIWWGNEGDLLDNRIVHALDLSGKSQASLSFWTQYAIETGWDFGFVQVSVDGGASWTSLANEATTDDYTPGAIDIAVANLPGLTGQTDGWVYQAFDLTPFTGQPILLQFRYVTDWAYTEKGWFLDEISVVADGDEIFHDDMETGAGDWQIDPADGWMITTGTIIGSQYYLVEWRNASGFDAGLQAYQTVYYDEDEWEVDRAPHSLPGMLLWHRNSLYSFDYTLGDAWYDSPSVGPKHALLVVDSHSFPYTWDSVQTITGQDLQVSGSVMPVDAAFTLQDTTAFTLRLGYDPHSGRYLDEPLETKTFGPRPGIKQFHDSLGYYPGLWCCFHNDIYFWDNDASAVVPAAADYTTKITWEDNTPAIERYGTEAAGSILGTGNPGDAGVQFGVHLAVQAQADTGTWGRIMVWNAPTLLDLEKTASRETVIPGGYLRYNLSVTNLSPIWQHFVVDDPLPEYTHYVLGGHYDEVSNSIHWEGTVPPEETAEIAVLVTLDADVPVGTQITNTAVLTDDALGDSDSITTEVVAP
jgi:immune inhibitor A